MNRWYADKNPQPVLRGSATRIHGASERFASKPAPGRRL
jgi:hypothetical protein